MLWGQPQPETVRDYTVAVEVGGAWREIAVVTGNYQRQRRHRLEAAIAVTAVRISVSATNGIDHARIFEVRAYS